MPQLLLMAAVGVAAWFGYKAIKKEMARVGDAVRDASNDNSKQQVKVVADLEPDPETGIYKPKE